MYPSVMVSHRDHNSDNSTSPDLDMMTLYRSRGLLDGRLEADLIHGILETNGIFSSVAGRHVFEVKVARADLKKAQRLIEVARASGEES